MKTNTRRLIPVLVSLLMTGVLPARIQAQEQSGNKDRGKLSDSDFNFVTEAARGSMMEIQAGELARDRGSSQAVKDFGQRMIDDHGKASDDLKKLAGEKGVTLPTELGDQERSHLDQLNKLSGAEFDREYTQMMLQDHESDLKKFQDAAQKSEDNDVKDFANRTASVIQQHLDTAKQIQAQEKTDQPGNGERESTREQSSTENRDRDTTMEPGTKREKNVTREKNTTREEGTKRHSTKNEENTSKRDRESSKDDDNSSNRKRDRDQSSSKERTSERD
jgi:putative membrane protein